jgi:hypothetical protein
MSAVLVALALAMTFIGTQTSYWLFKVLPAFFWWALAFYWNQLPVSTDQSIRTILVLVPIFMGLACLFWGFWVSKKLPTGIEKSGFHLPFMPKDDSEDSEQSVVLTRSQRLNIAQKRASDAAHGIRSRRN